MGWNHHIESQLERKTVSWLVNGLNVHDVPGIEVVSYIKNIYFSYFLKMTRINLIAIKIKSEKNCLIFLPSGFAFWLKWNWYWKVWSLTCLLCLYHKDWPVGKVIPAVLLEVLNVVSDQIFDYPTGREKVKVCKVFSSSSFPTLPISLIILYNINTRNQFSA